MIFVDNFFFFLNSINFWHPKLTLKVRFWHFLTNCHFKDFSLVACWFLAKRLAFKDQPSLKFHDRTDITYTSCTFCTFGTWLVRFDMAIQTVLHIVTVTLLVTLLVKSEPYNVSGFLIWKNYPKIWISCQNY